MNEIGDFVTVYTQIPRSNLNFHKPRLGILQERIFGSQNSSQRTSLGNKVNFSLDLMLVKLRFTRKYSQVILRRAKNSDFEKV